MRRTIHTVHAPSNAIFTNYITPDPTNNRCTTRDDVTKFISCFS